MNDAADHAAILDPMLTRVRSFTLGSAALLIIGAGEFGLMFLLPLGSMMRDARGPTLFYVWSLAETAVSRLKRLGERTLSEEEKAKIEALGGWDKLIETLNENLDADVQLESFTVDSFRL